MKKLLVLLGLFFAFPAFAADNAVIVTPGIGVTMKSKDIGAGVQAMQPVLSDTGGNALSTPTAGADAVSNTSTGLLAYSRTLFYNGTSWDRWQGAVTATLAAETTKVIGTVRVASGGIASGSIASGAVVSGAVASGAYASGSIASGAMVDLGAQADAACGTDNGSCSAIALIKRTNQNVTTLNTTAGSAVPSGTNVIGFTSVDPCSNANVKSFLPITATTSLVKVIATGVAAKKIYVCQLLLTVTAADNVAVFEATTGTTCATSAVAVYGAGTSVATAANGFPFPANGGISLGNGSATVGITTVNNNDLCIGTSAATPLTGGITYATQ